MRSLLITITDEVFEKAQRIAAQTAQPTEIVIGAYVEKALDSSLFELPADERAELNALVYLSDDALYNMMREQMRPAKQTRMQVLMDRNTRGAITDDEYTELSQLVEDGQRLTLRKATAMGILMDRGHQVGFDDMQTGDE